MIFVEFTKALSNKKIAIPVGNIKSFEESEIEREDGTKTNCVKIDIKSENTSLDTWIKVKEDFETVFKTVESAFIGPF